MIVCRTSSEYPRVEVEPPRLVCLRCKKAGHVVSPGNNPAKVAICPHCGYDNLSDPQGLALEPQEEQLKCFSILIGENLSPNIAFAPTKAKAHASIAYCFRDAGYRGSESATFKDIKSSKRLPIYDKLAGLFKPRYSGGRKIYWNYFRDGFVHELRSRLMIKVRAALESNAILSRAYEIREIGIESDGELEFEFFACELKMKVGYFMCKILIPIEQIISLNEKDLSRAIHDLIEAKKKEAANERLRETLRSIANDNQ